MEGVATPPPPPCGLTSNRSREKRVKLQTLIHRTVPVAVLVAAVSQTGCYVWREVQPSTATPGRPVRVTVDAEEAVRQQAALGRLTQQLEGVIVEGGSSDMLGMTAAGRTAGPAGETSFNVFLELPRSSVQRVEVREFSIGRTALLAGGGVAIVVTALSIDGGGTGGGSEDPGTNSRIRLPLIRIPVH